MSQEKHAIWYEPHPVSLERKAAIRAFGFRILDADFKPSDYENPEVPELTGEPAPAPAAAPAEKPAAQRKGKAAAEGSAEPAEKPAA